MATYAELMTAVIQKHIQIMGAKPAVAIARRVQEIRVSDDGKVTRGASKDTFELLLNAYKDISGPISLFFAKQAVTPILDGDEDLPQELKSTPLL
ncbi:MAG: hypothetical protein ABH829_02485 [archaeon]